MLGDTGLVCFEGEIGSFQKQIWSGIYVKVVEASASRLLLGVEE
jgi:hypothetical protein